MRESKEWLVIAAAAALGALLEYWILRRHKLW